MENALNLQTIETLAAATPNVLKKAFNRKSEQIAANFKELGKPMGGRMVRKMTEQSPDVTRRNILENTIILLGATRRESLRAFLTVWLFLEAVAGVFRGKVRIFATLEEQYSEVKYWTASADRSYFQRNFKQFEQDLINLDQSLKGLFAKLQLII